MRVTGRVGLILISSFALAGAAFAAGNGDKVHNLMIALPDGSVQHLRYTGDVAPQVVFLPAHAVAAPVAMIDDFYAPFAEMDRMAAEMDRQSDAMLRQAALLAAQGKAGAQPSRAVVGQLPAGSFSYSFVSTSTGNGTCSQSMQVTSYGPNQKPKVIQQTSGNCSAIQNRAVPDRAVPATQMQPDRAMPKLVPAKLDRLAAPAEATPANPT
jgi:hypothetical protein